MRRSSLLLRLLVPAGLALLVAVLGTLQYRWLGQVSEAERDRLKTSLKQRAEQFADEFDRELLRLFLALQTGGGAIDAPEDWQDIARRYDAWRETSQYPQLLRALYLVKDESVDPTLLRYDPDARTFAATPWPDSLAPVRQRLTTIRERRVAGEPFAARIVTLRDPIVADVPALMIPVPGLGPVDRSSAPAEGTLFAVHLSPGILIAELDRNYMQASFLPELAARHFPERESNSFRFAVVDLSRRGAPAVYARGVAPDAPIDPAKADAAVPLLTLRSDLTTEVFTRAGPARGGSNTQSPGIAVKPTTGLSIIVQSKQGRGDGDFFTASARPGSRPGWQLVLQHTAGSLDAFVAKTRRRNLWLSFSMLAVLSASVALIVLNAQRSQRLATQQMDFVATVSHELRTPLAVIRSAAQNLSAGVVQDSVQTRRYGEVIEDEGRRLTSMVEQVLEYATLSGNRRPSASRPIALEPVIRDVVAACKDLLDSSQIECRVDVADDVPEVMADEAALHRALQNLVINAVKYGGDGKSIEITARRAAAHARKDEVVISVIDRGPGIDAADLGHLFEPFYRGRSAVERQVQGNGLGLSLVKRVIEAHGGRVTGKSAPGAGATFTLHLPAQPRSTPSTKRRSDR